MNLILLEEHDFLTATRARLRGRRAEHIQAIHQAVVGDRLRVGLLNGQIGSGLILELDADQVDLEVDLQREPPEPLPVTLLLALPRPKMLKRILQSVAALGVKQIYLLNSYRVEKSFWNSPSLQMEKLREQLLLGLEQAGDTLLPTVHLRQRFKPFVEDELPELAAGTIALVAHPASPSGSLLQPGTPTTLAIGPEGGFIPYEIDKLRTCGFQPFSLGERILRVETAVPVLLSRLLPL